MTTTRSDRPGDEQGRTTLEIARVVASGWERQRASIEQVAAPVRDWMVRRLATAAGDTVLELASGAGDTGFAVAAALGEGGHLICSDVSPDMVEVARRRGAELGMDRVEYRVLDAERIDLATRSVDGVVCRFGYMLMADPERALGESRRVLRTGGRLVLSVWGRLEVNPWAAALIAVLANRGHLSQPQPGAPGPFALADPARLRVMMKRAGFAGVELANIAVRHIYADLEDYIRFVRDTAGPVALVVRDLSAQELTAVMAELEKTLAPFAGGDYQIPGVAMAAAAHAED
jgi:ubiquinone/menaquinone biosynthesis C-methylase UbiE